MYDGIIGRRRKLRGRATTGWGFVEEVRAALKWGVVWKFELISRYGRNVRWKM